MLCLPQSDARRTRTSFRSNRLHDTARPIESQASARRLNAVFKQGIFLDRIGVIKTQVAPRAAYPAVFRRIRAQAQIQANGLGMTDMQKPVRLRGKARDHFLMPPGFRSSLMISLIKSLALSGAGAGAEAGKGAGTDEFMDYCLTLHFKYFSLSKPQSFSPKRLRSKQTPCQASSVFPPGIRQRFQS